MSVLTLNLLSLTCKPSLNSVFCHYLNSNCVCSPTSPLLCDRNWLFVTLCVLKNMNVDCIIELRLCGDIYPCDY